MPPRPFHKPGLQSQTAQECRTAEQFRAPAALAEDLGLVLSTRAAGRSEPSVTPISGDPKPLLTSMGIVCLWYTHHGTWAKHPYA